MAEQPLGGVEDALRDLRGLGIEAIAPEAARDHRVVVWPDAPVLVAERVVADVVRRERSYAPTRPHVVREEAPDHTLGAVPRHDPRLKEMARVRGDGPDLPLGAVEPQRVGPLLLPPEMLVDPVEQHPGFAPQPLGVLGPAEDLVDV